MDIKNFLQSSYKKENFVEFIFDKFYGFEENDTDYEIPLETEQNSIQKYKFLGQVSLDDNKDIGFFEFVSTDKKDIENNRVSLNNILKKKVEDELLDGAIAVFYNPTKPNVWRLSFIQFSYDENDKQQVTNLKRYTYVLGKDIAIKTAFLQLKDLKYPTITELLTAFSVEKVSQEFFKQYKELYFDTCDYLQPQLAHFGNESNLKLFTKKLLGRIVFLYFLEKKGWLGSDENWENGDKKFLTNHFNTYDSNDFYIDILQPIFFEALNEDRKESNYYFKKLNCKMPFLNGGLFSKDEFDKRDIIIENNIFKNIFDIFDSYNFTIIEDSPDDSEVAIDPEMLGRVFEDLLEDRKDKGAFYTPREIVHYMCKQSIKNYLENEVKEYSYTFTVDEFLDKVYLDDDNILNYYEQHPIKFIKLENYFTSLKPYKNLVVDFWIVAKLKGFRLNANGKRVKTDKGHLTVTSNIWKRILNKEYEVVDTTFGSNKDINIHKSYKYPTILKYIKIDNQYFSLAFLPNIWGDLELTTIYPIRLRNIKSKLKNFIKSLDEIKDENFVFDKNVYNKIKELREDCRSLHPEPLQIEAELPRQAVIQKGLSTFHNSFTLDSISDLILKEFLKDKDYYNQTINKLLNSSTISQDKLKDIMNNKLKKITILDPAIGSGAFPMGMLHEIIQTRITLGDKTPLSKLKREIIENSIYGIDIEQSAVEIAKLRFWLSIVVDEDKPTPLPNLFYKIMVGNSLIETINGYNPLELHGNTNEMKSLKDKFHNFFRETRNIEKEKINNEIKRNINTILQASLKNFDIQQSLLDITKQEQKKYEEDFEKHMILKKIIQDYKSHNATIQLFLYKIYFKEVLENGGFDVVIGNPPYVRQEKIKELKSKKEIQDFESYCGTADLYIYFFEKGYKLLKPNGVLSYITSNKYTRAKYGKDFRKFVLDNTAIKEYIDFNGVKVFESATVDTSILTYQKTKEKDSNFIYCDINEKYKKGTELNKFIVNRGFDYSQNDLSEDSFNFASPQELRIKKQIEKIGKTLISQNWNIKINYGIKTGFNEAFIIDGKIKDELIEKDKKSAEIIKPILRGKDIKRYSYKFADKWLINLHNNPPLDIKEYPAIQEHLDTYYDKLEKRSDKGITPYNLRNCAYLDGFGNEKIIYPETVQGAYFYFDIESYYIDKTAFMIIGKDIKYIFAIISSKLVTYYYKNYCGGVILGEKGYQYNKHAVQKLPIPQIPKEQQKPFKILVDYILFAKEQDIKNEASLFESIIDGMVYDLYFEEDMKKADCFITSRVEEIVKPFGKYDNDNDKKMLITVIYDICKEDKTIQRCLIFSRNIEVVKVINGVKKDD